MALGKSVLFQATLISLGRLWWDQVVSEESVCLCLGLRAQIYTPWPPPQSPPGADQAGGCSHVHFRQVRSVPSRVLPGDSLQMEGESLLGWGYGCGQGHSLAARDPPVETEGRPVERGLCPVLVPTRPAQGRAISRTTCSEGRRRGRCLDFSPTDSGCEVPTQSLGTGRFLSWTECSWGL